MVLRPGPKELICSQRGCEEHATYAITWHNHTLSYAKPKHWLACDEHKSTLERYLAFRDFPQETQTLQEFLNSETNGGSKSTGVPLT